MESPKNMLSGLHHSLGIARKHRFEDVDKNGIGEYCGVETIWKNQMGTGGDVLRAAGGTIEILQPGPAPIWRSGTVPDWLMCVQIPPEPALAEKHYRVILWPRFPSHHPVAIIGTEATLPDAAYVQSFNSFGVEAFPYVALPPWGADASQYEALGWRLKPLAELLED